MARDLGGSSSELIRKVITGKCPEAAQAVSHPASLKAFISESLDYVVPDGIKIHEKKKFGCFLHNYLFPSCNKVLKNLSVSVLELPLSIFYSFNYLHLIFPLKITEGTLLQDEEIMRLNVNPIFEFDAVGEDECLLT